MKSGFADHRLPLFIVALILAVVVAWPPLSALLSPVQGSYNEGWNAYRQHATTRGVALYGAGPGYYVTNYTPLSFHMIGGISRFGFDVVLVGRVVSLISLVVVCVACGGIAFQVCRGVWAAAFAGVLFWIWLAVFDPLQLGVDDPQLLGMAFLMVGYWQYLRMGGQVGGAIVPAVLFSVALMIKQSFLPIPFAVGLHLVLCRRYADAVVYGSVGLVCCGVMFGLFYWIDGPFLLQNWFFARATSWAAAVAKTTPFIVQFQIGFVAAVCVVVARFGRDRVVQSLSMGLVASVATGFVAVAGDGVNQNLYFDALFMVCALAAGQVGLLMGGRVAGGGVPGGGVAGGRTGGWVAALLLLPAVFAVPGSVVEFRVAREEAGQVSRDHAAALALLRGAPGPAVCEHIKLCFDAGKTMTYDPFFVSDQLQIGVLEEAPIIALIDGQCYGSVELEMWRTEAAVTAAVRPRFTAAFMAHLFAHYRQAYASHDVANGVAVFLPIGGAGAVGLCRELPLLPARSSVG